MNISTNTIHHKTPCATSILAFFGVEGVTWNDRTKKNVWADTLRRAGFSVRSRTSKLNKKEQTVCAARSKIAKIATDEKDIIAFIACIKGHVLVIDRNGQTVVDTAPRKRDKRQIVRLVAIKSS